MIDIVFNHWHFGEQRFVFLCMEIHERDNNGNPFLFILYFSSIHSHLMSTATQLGLCRHKNVHILCIILVGLCIQLT